MFFSWILNQKDNGWLMLIVCSNQIPKARIPSKSHFQRVFQGAVLLETHHVWDEKDLVLFFFGKISAFSNPKSRFVQTNLVVTLDIDYLWLLSGSSLGWFLAPGTSIFYSPSVVWMIFCPTKELNLDFVGLIDDQASLWMIFNISWIVSIHSKKIQTNVWPSKIPSRPLTD